MPNLDFKTRRRQQKNPELYPAEIGDEGEIVPLDEEITPFFELSRLMVVALIRKKGSSDIQLMSRGQTRPNGPWEPDWSPIDPKQGYGIMAAGSTQDGRVAIVAQNIASTPGVFYIDEDENDDGPKQPNWNTPVDLKTPGKNLTVRHLAMARGTSGRIEIFAIDQEFGNIWWIYQNPPKIVTKTIKVTPPGATKPITITVQETAPPDKPWSDWIKLSGVLSSIVAANMADNRIILFGLNAAQEVWRSEQTVPQALKLADWSKWERMDNNYSGKFVALAPALDKAGAVNLFGINQGGQVLQARQSPPASASWGPWATPGYIRAGVQALATGIDGDGDVAIVATDSQKFHNCNFLRSATFQEWSGWKSFGLTSYPVQIALDYNADGRLVLFSHWVLPQSVGIGGLWCAEQIAFDSTEWSLEWIELAPGGVVQFEVVRDLTPPEGTNVKRRKRK